jgi:hypothetical protein
MSKHNISNRNRQIKEQIYYTPKHAKFCWNDLSQNSCSEQKNVVLKSLYISCITPNSGPIGGGNTVTIKGDGFLAVLYILFNDTQITNFNLIDNNTIQFIIPQINSGQSVKVYLVSSQLISNFVYYTYVDQPTLISINPSSGTIGIIVTLTGTNLSTTNKVLFNDNAVFFEIINDTMVNIAIPQTSTANNLISVITSGGQSNSLTYTYIPPPMI